MQYRASIVRWRSARGGTWRAGVRATHAGDWLWRLRECVPSPRVRIPSRGVQSTSNRLRVSIAPLCNTYVRTRLFRRHGFNTFFWIETRLSVHMVHLVDIFRSANVEYPPPIIVSKVCLLLISLVLYFLLFLYFFIFVFCLQTKVCLNFTEFLGSWRII